jgi:GDP-L-fucose synthase
MSILITGGSGFLGISWTRKLQELGDNVVALSSRDADLRNPSSLDKFCDHKFDIIVHLASWTQAGDFCLHHPGEQWLINQQINTTVLNWWASEQPQAKLISMGTSCAYGEPGDYREEHYLVGEPNESLYTYAMTKRMLLIGQMSLSKQFGLKWLTLVPSTIYGPHYIADGKQMHFIFDIVRKVLNYKYHQEPIVLWGDGHQRRELVYVEDFVNEALALNDIVENSVVNIGAGEDYSIREFAGVVCEAARVDPAVIQYDTSKYVGSRTKRLNTEKLDGLLPRRKRIPLGEGLGHLVAEMESSYKTGQAGVVGIK